VGRVDLPPGSRVLDLGCGNALASIFLAREFGVRVVAACGSRRTSPGAYPRAGCADSVMPLPVKRTTSGSSAAGCP
jgi:cyclopropane fatty-acyl-phospholipid synthase-like methyltransferase